MNTALDLTAEMDDLHCVAIIDRFGHEVPVTADMIDAMLDSLEPQTAYYGHLSSGCLTPVQSPMLTVVGAA